MITDYPQPNFILDLFLTYTGYYLGLDRFGRPIDHYWYGYSGTFDVARVRYGYDHASNRQWREDVKASDNGYHYDDYYTHDGLHRLKTFDRGNLTGGPPPTGISSPANEEDFTLDQLGNWPGYVVKAAGSTTLNQTRYHNAVNEIDGNGGNSITASTGLNWADPVYDAAGNTTSIPDAYSPTTSLSLKYDAWNRMVEVKSGADTVQVNEFDGLGRRIVRVHWIASASATYDYYYNEDWQLLEEQKEGDADPLQQYLWHPYYIDALALRWYDADVSGDPVAEYYLHSANFHVSAVTNDSGTVIERYIYTSYGDYSTFNGSYSIQGGSQIGNTHFYTGRERDPETYLQLNRHRFYYSYLGRWLSRDPQVKQLPVEASPDDLIVELRKIPNEEDSVDNSIHISHQEVDELIQRIEQHQELHGYFPRLKFNVTAPYGDGMSLYGGYFVPNGLDPTGMNIYCKGIGGFIGWIGGVSGSIMRCRDDCPGNNKAWVTCAGGGVYGGASVSVGGSISDRGDGCACLSSGNSMQLIGQAAGGIVGVTGGIDTGDNVSIGGGIGIGAGVGAGAEICRTW